MWRSIMAIFVGFVFIAVLAFGADSVLRSVMPEAYDANGRVTSVPVLILTLVYVGIFAIAGCYLAARLAPSNPMRHALILGVLGGYRGEPGATAEVFTQSWVAGVLELFGGLLVAAGLFTSPVAFVLSGLMAVAYFKAHAPDGFWPLLNGGELAALFCFVFLAFWALGGGRYSLDGLLARRRR